MYLFLIFIIMILLIWSRTPSGKGFIGELIVKLVIGKTKPNIQYVIHNLTIEFEGKTSQIDHILINSKGVFVIETKNYSGRIYGSENEREWLQVLNYGKLKNKFYNPIKQNATHIYRLKKILNNIDIPIFSLIVFVKNNTDYINASDVVPVIKLRKSIRNKVDIINNEKMIIIYNNLKNIKENNLISKKQHIKNIQKSKNIIDNNICPRCGRQLVLRHGKYGDFYGCSGYPKCKFIKK